MAVKIWLEHPIFSANCLKMLRAPTNLVQSLLWEPGMECTREKVINFHSNLVIHRLMNVIKDRKDNKLRRFTHLTRTKQVQ
uniref:Uncharacterized protein n=1 Tax=Oryza barthii TaxID=65489 RepID=A0A0D3ENR7_9ORYZ